MKNNPVSTRVIESRTKKIGFMLLEAILIITQFQSFAARAIILHSENINSSSCQNN